MSGVLSISGIQSGQAEGGLRNIGTFSISMGTVGQTTETTLASGANTITVPTGSVGVVIVPDADNTTALTLKGVSGDTGISISPSDPTLLTFGTAPASIVVTAASLLTTTTAFIFF